MLIDLSHRIAPGMPSYPGLLEPKFHTWLTHQESATRGTYAPGTTFQIATYELGGNTGTYLDAPFHRYPTGPDMADLPLEKVADLPGRLIVTALREGALEADVFEGVEVTGKAVLVRTDWSKRWGGDYFRSGPFLTAAACRWLVEQGAALVGIDCANIDDMTDPARPAHTILLHAGIPIVEHLRGLDQLPPGREFRFFAVPPAIEGGTSFPVRAFASL